MWERLASSILLLSKAAGDQKKKANSQKSIYILKVHYGLTRKKRITIEITTKIRNIWPSIY
jgi:hypothetical protein